MATSRSLEEFSRRIQVRGRKIEENADNLVRKVALAADQAVVMGTPVDTGRAKSNWIAQINSAPSDVIEAYVPGGEGWTADDNEQAAMAQAEGIIRNYRYGDEIHITNNLPYIQRLNDGYSPQAGANFVEEAILEAAQIVQYGRIVDDNVGGTV